MDVYGDSRLKGTCCKCLDDPVDASVESQLKDTCCNWVVLSMYL